MKRLLLLVLLVSGCADEAGRSRLSGAAMFDGTPIVYGEIVFQPDRGPEGRATIRDGKYDTASEAGRGIVRGANVLVVTGYESEPLSTGDETFTSDAVTPLFSSYELQADLVSDIFDFDVPANAAKKTTP